MNRIEDLQEVVSPVLVVQVANGPARWTRGVMGDHRHEHDDIPHGPEVERVGKAPQSNPAQACVDNLKRLGILNDAKHG